MVKIDPTASLSLRANGDWPTMGKCLTFSPSNLFFAKNVGGRNPVMPKNIPSPQKKERNKRATSGFQSICDEMHVLTSSLT